MLQSRKAPWRTSCQALALGAILIGGVPAFAFDARDESLTVAEEQAGREKDVVGESVGEPAVEDAPVEGEPGPGDAVHVPTDEAGDAGDDSEPSMEGGAGEPKQVEQ